MKAPGFFKRILLITLLGICSLVAMAATPENSGRKQALELLAQSSQILDKIGLDVSQPYPGAGTGNCRRAFARALNHLCSRCAV